VRQTTSKRQPRREETNTQPVVAFRALAVSAASAMCVRPNQHARPNTRDSTQHLSWSLEGGTVLAPVKLRSNIQKQTSHSEDQTSKCETASRHAHQQHAKQAGLSCSCMHACRCCTVRSVCQQAVQHACSCSMQEAEPHLMLQQPSNNCKHLWSDTLCNRHSMPRHASHPAACQPGPK
jgi:hypothetical protein